LQRHFLNSTKSSIFWLISANLKVTFSTGMLRQNIFETKTKMKFWNRTKNEPCRNHFGWNRNHRWLKNMYVISFDYFFSLVIFLFFISCNVILTSRWAYFNDYVLPIRFTEKRLITKLNAAAKVCNYYLPTISRSRSSHQNVLDLMSHSTIQEKWNSIKIKTTKRLLAFNL